MRILKQCAIGCQIHYNRNVLATDEDNSPTCDYNICKYDCVNSAPKFIDYSTYDVLYSNEVVVDVISSLATIYRQVNVSTLDQLVRDLDPYQKKFIIMGLENIITNKIPLVDRFGYLTYLREDNGYFYLDRNYPSGSKSSHAMSYYTQGIIAIEQETLSKIITTREMGSYQERISELEMLNPNDPMFNNILDNMSIEGRAMILEDVIFRVELKKTNLFTDTIMKKYSDHIFHIHDPVTELSKAASRLGFGVSKRGRKRNPNLKRRIHTIDKNHIKQLKELQDQETPMVYLHTLYSISEIQTSYSTTARYNKGEGRTRILKPSDPDASWRDLNEIELPIYNIYIQIEKAEKNRKYEETGLYGFILPEDNKFKIRDRLGESAEAKTDGRRVNRGKECITWPKPHLYDVMWEIKVPLPDRSYPDYTEEDREELIDNLTRHHRTHHDNEELENWELDRLIYYNNWLNVGKVTRQTICENIRTQMELTGRLRT